MSDENEVKYQCGECGTEFHVDQNDDSPLTECPECKSDNASPLNS